jgi:hypothetical protein
MTDARPGTSVRLIFFRVSLCIHKECMFVGEAQLSDFHPLTEEIVAVK